MTTPVARSRVSTSSSLSHWVTDLVLLTATPFVALAIRMESVTFSHELNVLFVKYVVGAVAIRLLANWRVGAYRALWHYASAVDVSRLLAAVLVSSAACLVYGGFLVRFIPPQGNRLALAVILIDCALAATAVIAPRLWRRLSASGLRVDAATESRVLVVGAGRLGQLMLQDLRTASVGLFPVGFVDDDRAKHERSLSGVPVLGGVDALPALIEEHRANLVIIAIRDPNGALVRRVLDATSAAGISAKLVPAPSEVAAGTKVVQALRTVDIDDLLRRPRVQSDLAAVHGLIHAKTVMVTGAGGAGVAIYTVVVDNGAQDRIALWSTTINMAAHNAWRGVGVSQIPEYWGAYVTRMDAATGNLFRNVDEVHNGPLQQAAELGVVGFIAYTTFIVGVLVSSVRLMRRPSPVQLAAAAGFLVFALQDFFSPYSPVITLWGWVCAGIILGSVTAPTGGQLYVERPPPAGLLGSSRPSPQLSIPGKPCLVSLPRCGLPSSIIPAASTQALSLGLGGMSRDAEQSRI